MAAGGEVSSLVFKKFPKKIEGLFCFLIKIYIKENGMRRNEGGNGNVASINRIKQARRHNCDDITYGTGVRSTNYYCRSSVQVYSSTVQ